MERFDLEKFDDDVDRYFKGQMSESEEVAFMARVDTDPELKQRLTIIALMKKSMHDIRIEETQYIGEEIEAMDEKAYRQHSRHIPPHNPKILWPQYLKYVAAACIIGFITVSVWYLTRNNPYTDLGESCDYYAYNTDLSAYSPRGDDVITQNDIDNLKQLFLNIETGQDLARTTKALEKALSEASAVDSDLTDPIAWNLAIGELKKGDGKKAKEILTGMLERNQGLYIETENAVRQLLDKIDYIGQ